MSEHSALIVLQTGKFLLLVDIFIFAYWHMLSGNMFELVAYCVAYYCVSCFITMLCHLAFSSNILDDWCPAPVNILTCFVTWLIVTWVTLLTLGRLIYHRFMALCANLNLLFGSSLTYGRSSGRGFILLLSPHECSQCLVVILITDSMMNKLMIWKMVLGLHSDRTTHIF